MLPGLTARTMAVHRLDMLSWRTFFQFSLRSLFILTTICAISFGWRLERARKQRQIMRDYPDVGFLYDYESAADGFAKQDAVHWAPQWLLHRVGIDFFSDVVAVVIHYDDMKAAKAIGELPALRHVTIVQPNRDDWPQIQHFSRINSLYIVCSDVLLDRHIGDIASLRKLERLRIGIYDNSLITDAGLRHLKKLPELRHVELDRLIQITPAGIQDISEALPSCKIRYRLWYYGYQGPLRWVYVGCADANDWQR